MDLIITLILFLNFENKIDKNKTEGTEIATTFQKKKTRVCTVKSVNKASPPLTKKKKESKVMVFIYLARETISYLNCL